MNVIAKQAEYLKVSAQSYSTFYIMEIVRYNKIDFYLLIISIHVGSQATSLSSSTSYMEPSLLEEEALNISTALEKRREDISFQ